MRIIQEENSIVFFNLLLLFLIPESKYGKLLVSLGALVSLYRYH